MLVVFAQPRMSDHHQHFGFLSEDRLRIIEHLPAEVGGCQRAPPNPDLIEDLSSQLPALVLGDAWTLP